MDWYMWEMDRRYQEHLEDARLGALARLASAGGSEGISAGDRLLSHFGSVLVVWGLRLQGRTARSMGGY